MSNPKGVRTFKKTIQIEFNKMMVSGKPCAKCGEKYERMECSHNKSIGAYPNLRYDPMNVLPMDSRHHIWWWHDEPTESGNWFKEKYPGRYMYLLEAKNKYTKWTMDKLLEVRKHIKDKNLRALVIAPELLDIKK